MKKAIRKERISFFANFFQDSADILVKRTITDTIEIYIQGGINAENGFQSSFMVYPVQMVAKTSKPKRENGKSGQKRPDSGASGFRHFLDSAVEDACPAECYVVTYNASSRLQTYRYKSREYTF